MSHTTPTQVREITGTPLVTLLYAPWPVRWVSHRAVRGYMLTGRARRAPASVLELPWNYAPNALLAQLAALPTDREIEMLLPLPGVAGSAVPFGWVRGWFEAPASLTGFNVQNWGAIVARLTGAVVV